MRRLPFAKPPKRRKRKPKPLKRSGPIARSSSPKRGKKPKAKNATRRESEFARCYGSKERVDFVKALPCVYCIMVHPLLALGGNPWHCDNAHTANGGKGRKGDYTTIVPLDRRHHQMYDEHRGPFADPAVRAEIAAYAARVESLWQRELLRRGVIPEPSTPSDSMPDETLTAGAPLSISEPPRNE